MGVIRTHKLIAAVLFLPLMGCASMTRSTYTRPTTNLPANYFSQPDQGEQERPPHESRAWWDAFGDAQLTTLIESVLANNADVQVAAIRVKRARLQAGLAEDSLWVPVFNAGGDASTTTRLDSGDSTRSFSASAGASYRVDLWGPGRHELDAAQWEAAASEWDLAGVRLSISATTATLYWQLSYLDARINLSEQSIAYARQTLEVTQVRREAGVVSDLDVLQAERSLVSQRANHQELLRQRQATGNALSVLFDAPPSPKAMSVSSLPDDNLPPINAGLPADLLMRRPDLRAAESRLRSLLAQHDATRASYLPTLTLSGSIGSVAESMGDLLTNPAGTLAASIALPFLNWNQMQLQVDLSQTDYNQAAVSFRQTLYRALEESETALSNRQAYLAQRDELASALSLAKRSESLFEIRYNAGDVSIQDWLDAQETRRSAEIGLLDVTLNLLINRVEAYEALGGSTPYAEDNNDETMNLGDYRNP